MRQRKLEEHARNIRAHAALASGAAHVKKLCKARDPAAWAKHRISWSVFAQATCIITQHCKSILRLFEVAANAEDHLCYADHIDRTH